MYRLFVVLALLTSIAFCGNNMAIYQDYLNDTEPNIVETVEEYTQDGVYVHKLKFLSRVSDGQDCVIYGILCKPVGTGPYPGLLNVHGGGGSADQMFPQVFDWAKLGYVAFCQDQPGIGGSSKSYGPFNSRSMYDVTPDATYSKLYDGILAGVNGLRMVRSQPETDVNNIGVTGGSWGGFMTAMVSGISGDRVDASFAIYGCGYYDVGSEWRRNLETLSPTDKAKWLDGLDAGRKASQMTSNYFLTSPTNDWYFWPSAMMATFGDVPNQEKNFAICANAAHYLSFPGGTSSSKHGPHRTYMEVQWMNYWLKGEGTKFGRCEPVGTPVREGDNVRVTFQYTGATPEEATEIWYAYGETPTKSGWWREVTVTDEGNSVYSGLIPIYETEQPLMWYGEAFDYLGADNREYTVSTTYQTFLPTDIGFTPAERRNEIFTEGFEGLTVRWKRPYAKSFDGRYSFSSTAAHTGSMGLKLTDDQTVRCDGLRGEAMKIYADGLKMWVKNVGQTDFAVQLMSEEPSNQRWYWRANIANTGDTWTEIRIPWSSFAVDGTTAQPPMDMISTGLAQLRILTPPDSEVYIDDISVIINDPLLAKNPSPAYGEIDVIPQIAVLNWEPGDYAAQHDVYVGTDFQQVTDATTTSSCYQGRVDVNNFNAGTLGILEPETLTYWRIDEVNDTNVWTGEVWNFTTGNLRKAGGATDTTLVGHWKFDETSGSTAYDSAGIHDGTLFDGPIWQSTGGRIGGAIHFDGTNDYVKIPDFDYQGDNNECTISYWFTLADANNQGHGFMFSHGYYVDENNANMSFRGEDTTSTGKITAWYRTTGQGTWNPSTAGTYVDSNWHLYTYTMSSTSGLRIYLDGAEAGSSVLYPGIFDPAYDIHVGCVFSGSSRSLFFGNTDPEDAKIDDLRIYNRALSNSEVSALMNPESNAQLASSPTPVSGATSMNITSTLAWDAGSGATSHDVYFGTNFIAIANADHNSPEFMGNFAPTTFDPGTLDWSTTYYWAIDEVAGSTTTLGEVWAFSTQDAKASLPTPADKATGVELDPILSWTAGIYADETNGHDVYFGTDYTAVASANHSSTEFQGTQTDTTFDPGTLEYETTYYWVVDEINGAQVYAGNIWSFRTTSDKVAWYKFDETSGKTAADAMDNYPATLISFEYDTWIGGFFNGALMFDGMTNYVAANPIGWPEDESTINIWFKPDATINNTSGRQDLYTINSDRPYLCFNKSATGKLYFCPRFYDDATSTIIYASDIVSTTNTWQAGKWYCATTTYDGQNVKLYIDGILEASASVPDTHNGPGSFMHIGNKTSGGGFRGVIDDLRIYNRGLAADEVVAIANSKPVSSTISAAAGSELTWEYNLTDADNRILVVGLAAKDANDADLAVTSVTYAGFSMHPVTTAQSTTASTPKVQTELYYLLDYELPADGTHSIVVNYAGQVDARAAGVTLLTDCRQLSPDTVATSQTDGQSIDANVATTTDKFIVVDVVGCASEGSFATNTNSQEEQYDTTNDDLSIASSVKQAQANLSTLMSWTNSAGGQTAQSAAAFHLKMEYQMVDLDQLVENWLSANATVEQDLKPDGIINFLDFAVLASDWMDQ
jgi:dienelactone hydrolase